MSRSFTKVIITGGRDFEDFNTVKKVLDCLPKIELIIQGGAKGADLCAKNYAHYRGVRSLTYLADWNQYGKSAGPLRNSKMLNDHKDALVVSFPGGRGTKHCTEEATKLGLPVLVVSVKNNEVFVLAINEEVQLTVPEEF